MECSASLTPLDFAKCLWRVVIFCFILFSDCAVSWRVNERCSPGFGDNAVFMWSNSHSFIIPHFMSHCSSYTWCPIVSRTDGVCLKISELFEETDRLHEQALSRQHEMKSVLSSLESFKSRSESLLVKLTAFKAQVDKQVTRPLSTDVDAIKVDLHLIKVLRNFCFLLSHSFGHQC